MSGGYPKPRICGEHYRKNRKPHMAWCVLYTNGKPDSSKVSEPSYDRTFLIRLFVKDPVLQPYTIDPKPRCSRKTKKIYDKNGKLITVPKPDLGFAALWPDLVDLEKIGYKAKFGWRLREANDPGGIGVVFLAGKKASIPIRLPMGVWFLSTTDPFFTIIGGISVSHEVTDPKAKTTTIVPGLSKEGEGDTPAFDPPAAARQALLGTWLYAQGVALDAKTGAVGLTNWCGTNF